MSVCFEVRNNDITHTGLYQKEAMMLKAKVRNKTKETNGVEEDVDTENTHRSETLRLSLCCSLMSAACQ